MADPSAAFEAYVFDDGEKLFYSMVFRAIEKNGFAQGDDVAQVFRRSNLPDETLGKIWDIADRSLKGYLTKIELFVALRAVALAQNTREPITVDTIAVQNGLALSHLPRLGPDFPLPSEVEIAAAHHHQSSDLNTVIEPQAINPQFNVSVSQPTKHEGNIQDHMVYAITVHCTMGLLNSTTSVVNRRYSDFEWLRQRLLEQSMGHVVPPLPTKKYFGRFEREFLEARREGLESFLNRITADPQLLNAKPLITFLQADDRSFAKAKASGPSLVDQVILAIQEMSVAIQLSIKGIGHAGKGNAHSLPTDARLEDFNNALQTIKTRLKDVKRLHETYLVTMCKRLESELTLVACVVPSAFPLSHDELTKAQDEILEEISTQKTEHAKHFGNVVDTIINQVRAVQEVINQRKDAHQKFQTLQQRVDAKQHKVAALKNNAGKTDARGEAERDLQSLTKESDAARHKFDVISKALEKEIRDFEKMRQQQLVKALQAITNTEASWASFQVKWWENLLRRMEQANASALAATIDVPKVLLAPAACVMCLPSDSVKIAPKNPLFVVGQCAEQTIPPPGYQKPEPRKSAPTSVTSWGHAEAAWEVPHNTAPSKHRSTHHTSNRALPSYAQATVSSDLFHKIGDKHSLEHDGSDNDDFVHCDNTGPTTASTPAHWA